MLKATLKDFKSDTKNLPDQQRDGGEKRKLISQTMNLLRDLGKLNRRLYRSSLQCISIIDKMLQILKTLQSEKILLLVFL